MGLPWEAAKCILCKTVVHSENARSTVSGGCSLRAQLIKLDVHHSSRVQMRHSGDPSTSSKNVCKAKEHGVRTASGEDKAISWMVQQHAGVEMTAKSSAEIGCRREFDSYLD